ncbi:Bromodomain-containing protein, partial [Ramicandelaber brevisporus]
FLRPVDTSAYPDYLAIIKQPMDLGTMRARLAADMYTNLAIFRHDFELVCRNSMAFNSPESIYHQAAQKL